MNRLGLLIGLAFGFLLAAARASDYDAIHNMLLLRELDLYLLMGSAVAVAAPLLWLLEGRRWRTPLGGALVLKRYAISRKDFLGAVVFGAGWAIAGTCPGPALAMLGGGQVLSLFVIAGLTSGLLLRDAVVARATMPRPAPTDAGAAVAGD